jgi:glycosyltransferase involved in cell wall biosynthesis
MAYYESLRERRRELGIEEEMRFVFESGPRPDAPYTIGADVVGDLYRVSDVVFMPSHREGFGMPVLEAGMAGVAVASTPIPASVEIGGEDVLIFEASEPPERVAGQILDLVADDRIHRLRRRVRRKYTWSAIFHREIRPLLHHEEAS